MEVSEDQVGDAEIIFHGRPGEIDIRGEVVNPIKV
jgi:hypothetical protein